MALSGAGLLAVATFASACDQQDLEGQSLQSGELAADPERIVEQGEPILDDVTEEPTTAPLDPPPEGVASDTVERIDALAVRIRDEPGPARKAAIREAMSVVAELPPDEAAALLARLDRTATAPDHERHEPVVPPPQGD